MAHDGGGSPQDLVVQTWTMYSIAMVLFLLRIYARYTRLGLKFQIEDYLMVFAVCLYTVFAVTNITIIQGGGSSLYLPDQFDTFTPQDILARIEGSKIEVASEMCMLNTMYTLKACMLFIYFQLTANLKQNRLVKICAVYTFCGWLATVLLFFFNCHPFSGYWTLPPPQEECATYFRYEVTQAVFNISSDLAMLSIILPMLFRMRMPWKTKVPLVFIFSMGLVVVTCACTSKYFTFRDIWDDSYQFWYLREASIAMYVTNLPYVWSLARQTFRVLRSSDTNTGDRSDAPYGTGLVSNPRSKMSRNQALGRIYNMDTINDRPGAAARSESEENIIEAKETRVGSGDFAKYADGSETMAWARSEGRSETDERSKEDGIRKTTDVTIVQQRSA
ncbi:hypothetical protein N431DRAFT_385617 [Stipitochalara longipes BDJ]|nr:hypothetical protein N431DRAFT_385617 [Stipitochalara longipes BDJ]